MNAIVIGDVHLSGNNLSESEVAVQDIVNYVSANKTSADVIVFLGDVCDKFQNLHISVLRVMNEMIRSIANSAKDIPIYIIAGNHDRPNNQHYLTNEHPFHGLAGIPTVNIVASQVLETTIKGFKLLFVPYVPEGRFEEAISDSNKSLSGTSCIFAHQTVFGAPLGSCKSETGDKWTEDKPLVISGHIHGYSVVYHNWIYAGMAWQQHYTDSPDRAIMLVRFGGKTLKNKANDVVSYDRYKLPSIPTKITVELTCEELKSYKLPKSADVCIKLSGTAEEIQAVLKLARVQNITKNARVVLNRVRNVADYEEDRLNGNRETFRDMLERHIPKYLSVYHKEILNDVERCNK